MKKYLVRYYMKILGINSYKYSENNKKLNNSNIGFSVADYQQDSVSFSARYPKGYKQIEKAVRDTTKHVKRHIKNSAIGEFSVATQKQVENLHNNLKIVKDFFKQFETNPRKEIQIKKGYDKLIITKGKRGYTFKLDDTKTLNITQSQSNNDLIRMTVSDNDKSTHYLLAGYNKAVSNLNQKNPQLLPQKLRYMTADEINNSPIKQYISIADKEIKDFSKYLLNQENISKVSSKKAKLIPELTNKMPIYSPVDIISFFNKNEIQKLPEQAKPMVSKTGTLLGFKMPLSDGGELLVTKKISTEYGADLTYISIKETTADGIERYFAIDCTTNDFLKTRTGGKPIVTNNNVYSYTPSEMKEKNIKNNFNRYMNEIIGASKSSENNHSEITVLNTKKAKFDDIDLEQIEDRNISKQIEKEIAAQENAEKISKESDLYLSKSIKKESEIIDPKTENVSLKIEKPEIKEEPETIQQKAEDFSQNMAEKLAKMKEEAVLKATGDAKIFAETYFRTFIEQFQTSFNAKVLDFTEKFQDLLKSFVK